MLFGYARVSTLDQNPQLQQDALEVVGCDKVFTDKVTGTAVKRPELSKLKELREGDTLVVWRLDRLGRSLKDLIEWVTYLEDKGVGLKSLQEAIDTTTPSGELVFHRFAALAEFERNLIRQGPWRVSRPPGRVAARAAGQKPSPPSEESVGSNSMTVKRYRSKNFASCFRFPNRHFTVMGKNTTVLPTNAKPAKVLHGCQVTL